MMDKAKEAINKMKKEYQKRIGELLTEEYEFHEGSIDTVSALSNAHSLEAGVHTLNTLERILDDEEYAFKEWSIKNTETKPPVETILKYDVICSGVYLEGDTAMVYISNTMLNELFDELYVRGYIENKHIGTSTFKIENDGSIIANTEEYWGLWINNEKDTATLIFEDTKIVMDLRDFDTLKEHICEIEKWGNKI